MNHKRKKKIVDLLKEVKLFYKSSENELKGLADSVEIINLTAGKTIIEKGTDETDLYIIVEGKVKIHDDEYTYKTTGKGKYFGEYALFHTKKRNASVTAVEDTCLLKIGQADFRNHVRNNPEVKTLVLESLIDTIVQKNKLERELAVKNEQIQKQKEDLEKAIRLKDRFFALISHDLRSPLSSLSSYLNLLINSNILSKKEISDYASDLKSSLNNVNEMLDNMLNWAVSKTDEWQIDLKEFDILNSVNRCVALYQSAAEQKNIELVNRCESQKVYADELSADVAIRNLISNAIKFTPGKGKVEIFSKENEDSVSLFVKDNGVGMDDKVKESLFKMESFQYLRGTENEKGTGLGLILAREFILKNGGELYFESSPGKGSVFQLVFPKG